MRFCGHRTKENYQSGPTSLGQVGGPPQSRDASSVVLACSLTLFLALGSVAVRGRLSSVRHSEKAGQIQKSR